VGTNPDVFRVSDSAAIRSRLVLSIKNNVLAAVIAVAFRDTGTGGLDADRSSPVFLACGEGKEGPHANGN
jgi:hypothetical protein